MVKVNGELLPLDGVKLMEYLEEHNFKLSLVAVELNGEILPKADYSACILHDGDSVEVVSFVGGG